MKKQLRSLKLSRETLRHLEQGISRAVVGGTLADSCVQTCLATCVNSCLEYNTCFCPPG
jgi:secreted trypsin-like serine protease